MQIKWPDITFPPINLYSMTKQRMKIDIYGAPNCTYCQAAKNLCITGKYDYNYIELTTKESREEFERKTGTVARTVPQIVVDGKLIGGFQAFKNFMTQPD